MPESDLSLTNLAWAFAIVVCATSILWMAALALGAWVIARIQDAHCGELERQHANHRRVIEALVVGDGGRDMLSLTMEQTAAQEAKKPPPMPVDERGRRLRPAQ